MVMERPTGGVTSGGVGSAVGAGCQAVVDHLAAGGGRRASVWLEHRGQLRAVAVSGAAGSESTGSTGSTGSIGTDGASEAGSAPRDGHWRGPAAVVRSAFEAGIET